MKFFGFKQEGQRKPGVKNATPNYARESEVQGE